ncbi:putative hexosaminidase d-like protein, partial [Operophtera brumata]
ILFEWEDSFPYTGHLITIGSLGGSSRDDLYSEDEITDLLQFTQDNRLEPVSPYYNTIKTTVKELIVAMIHQLLAKQPYARFIHIGADEVSLFKFVHMRELREFPSVLCPTRPGGRELIVAMIHQLLAKQPYARFIHIGADENYGVDSLFLDHIRSIVMDVHKTYPNYEQAFTEVWVASAFKGANGGNQVLT